MQRKAKAGDRLVRVPNSFFSAGCASPGVPDLLKALAALPTDALTATIAGDGE